MPRRAATPTVPYASQKKYRANNPEKIKEINKRYYEKNKAKLQEARMIRYYTIEKPEKERQDIIEQLVEVMREEREEEE